MISLFKLAIVGDALTDNDVNEGLPFRSSAGKFLRLRLHRAGIDVRECLLTNVFNIRPYPTLSVKNLCGEKATALAGFPQIEGNKRDAYIRAEFAPEIARLESELTLYQPNLILALGETPLWALTKETKIARYRGSVINSRLGFKLLPTFHPSNILRNQKELPIFHSDLSKAAREAHYPEIRRLNRYIHIEPNIDDILNFEREYINPSDSLSIDIETAGNQITEIGFAPSKDRALVIPFFDDRKANKSYWETLELEQEVWRIVRRLCGLNKAKFVGQNFNYDMLFLLRSYGIACPHANHDTMLLHHALQPEMPKGLGMLATLYTDERPWKFMRPKHTTKQADE